MVSSVPACKAPGAQVLRLFKKAAGGWGPLPGLRRAMFIHGEVGSYHSRVWLAKMPTVKMECGLS